MRKKLIILLLVAFTANSFAQKSIESGLNAITARTVEAPLSFLASDWTEGREMGTKGEYMAGDYIASIFQMYGIKPLGDMETKRMSREFKLKGATPETYRSYFQNFDLVSEIRKVDNELELITKNDFSISAKKLMEGADYLLSGSYEPVEIEAPIVFLGYGLKNKALKCDPYLKANVKGKIVFILSGYAGSKDHSSVNYKTISSDSSLTANQIEKDKIDQITKAGALAVLKYNPDQKIKSANPSNLPMFYDNEFYEGDQPQDDFYLKKISLPNWEKKEGIPVIMVTKTSAESILPDSGNLLPALQKSDYNMASFTPVEIPSSRIHLKFDVERKIIRARNVLGYIEGESRDEVIVIGAHYDHVGKYNGFIFNGADDNASGTAGMLTLARAFKESGVKPAKTIIFAAWTGEEQGLWGSKYFVKNIPDRLSVKLNVNMDMIGRTSIKDDSPDYLSMQYTKGHEQFESIFKNIVDENKFELKIKYWSEDQPKGSSDFVSFAKEGVPVISLFTGLHKDYHMPNDELEFLDIPKMVEIIKLTYLGVNRILEEESMKK